MELEITQHHQTEKKQSYWTMRQIAFACYLAGPIGGCYFLGRNYKEAGLSNHSKRCYIIGIMGTLLLVAILSLIPEHIFARIPNSIVLIAYSSVIIGFAQFYQKKLIDEKLKEGYKRFSYWWCFLVILSLLVIQIPLVFLFSFLMAAIV